MAASPAKPLTARDQASVAEARALAARAKAAQAALAELPQADAGPRQLRVRGDEPEDVPRRRVGVHAEEQVG